MRLGIRGKLLLATLGLAIVPVLGLNQIRDLEAYLRAEQEQRLLNRAAIMAGIIGAEPGLFGAPQAGDGQAGEHVYVRSLNAPIRVDGYPDDWQLLGAGIHHLGSQDAARNTDLAVSYRIGVHKKDLYLIVQVKDDTRIYQHPGNPRLDQSDHLRLAFTDPAGRLHRYVLGTIAPGWVNAQRMSDTPWDPIPLAAERRIKAEWQERAGGYNIELRLPIGLIGERLAFEIADVDDPRSAHIEARLGTGSTDFEDTLGTIVIPSPRMEHMLESLTQASTRLWVIDRSRRVMAVSGALGENETPTDIAEGTAAQPGTLATVSRLFYRLILPQPQSEFEDELSLASRLNAPVVLQALAGEKGVHWREAPGGQTGILTAAHPVFGEHGVIGAVAIEKTGNSVLILQNRAMEILINLSTLAFVLTALILLAFATRLIYRVRRLRKEAGAAIGGDGRVQGTIKTRAAGDELGDLQREFAHMLERLAQYNRYLEGMAGKLSHELRTPVSVVRSSLDNLELAQLDDHAHTYAQRAREGVERLSGILTRMSEATRLEQILQNEDLHDFDLRELIQACLEGYRMADPGHGYELNTTLPERAHLHGSPDLIAQMLDKLIDNARDFAEPGTAILIGLNTQGERLILSVANQGAPLPEEMQGNLFDSMVSIRGRRSDEPHLGLGLYIVRLIADFHKGHVEARNREDVPGAEFRIKLPKA